MGSALQRVSATDGGVVVGGFGPVGDCWGWRVWGISPATAWPVAPGREGNEAKSHWPLDAGRPGLDAAATSSPGPCAGLNLDACAASSVPTKPDLFDSTVPPARRTRWWRRRREPGGPTSRTACSVDQLALLGPPPLEEAPDRRDHHVGPAEPQAHPESTPRHRRPCLGEVPSRLARRVHSHDSESRDRSRSAGSPPDNVRDGRAVSGPA